MGVGFVAMVGIVACIRPDNVKKARLKRSQHLLRQVDLVDLGRPGFDWCQKDSFMFGTLLGTRPMGVHTARLVCVYDHSRFSPL